MTEAPVESLAPVELTVSGNFGFTRNRDLREVLRRYPRGARAFVVDLASVEQLDSSALGMLLQLRDHSRDGDAVTVINPSPAVRAALADAEVGHLFPVDES